MVTLHEIAREAGVSIATVSATINNSRPVAPKTRKRVQKAIDRLGYRPNQIARALKKGVTKKIIYIIPSITNLVFGKFVYEIQREIVEHGYDLILYNNGLSKKRTRQSTDLLEKSRVDGVIISQTSTCGTIIHETCLERNIPLLVFQTPHVLKGVDMVISNDEEGTGTAVQYLIKRGHREIGFMMVKNSRVHTRRFNGYKSALEGAGIKFDLNKVIFSPGHEEDSGQACLEEFLAEGGERISALICCNDYMAIGAMRALQKFGIRIPEDISLIGYDNSVGRYTIPALSTVDFDEAKMAATAISVLLKRIKNPEKEIEKISFLPKLLIRDSTN